MVGNVNTSNLKKNQGLKLYAHQKNTGSQFIQRYDKKDPNLGKIVLSEVKPSYKQMEAPKNIGWSIAPIVSSNSRKRSRNDL